MISITIDRYYDIEISAVVVKKTIRIFKLLLYEHIDLYSDTASIQQYELITQQKIGFKNDKNKI